MSEGRSAESLEEYYSSLSAEERDGIEAMDMWPAYIGATRKWIEDAGEKIVFDRFHVMAHVEKAVDTVRKRENRELIAEGDERLKGTKWLWLYKRENVPDKHRSTLEFLRGLNLKVGRAWAIKETLRGMWNYLSVGWARKFFERWYSWAVRSRLKPIRNVARMIREHLNGILNYCLVPITKLSDYYDVEIDATIRALASLIEPVLICVIGAVIGVIVVSLYLPIFNLVNIIQ